MAATFVTDTFKGSGLYNHISGTSNKKYLEAHLSGAQSAILYHEKANNPGQVKFFTEAVQFISKKLKIK